MRISPSLYGVMAEFDTPDHLVEAIKRTRQQGYRKMDAYTPFPIHEVFDAMEDYKTPISAIVLGGGITGATFGFTLQTWTSVFDYPLNIGGRPTFSWPSFIPITFESMVLFAAFSAVIGMLLVNGLPKPYHPVFNVPGFERASFDRFFMCVEAADPLFDSAETMRFMQELGARRVTEVRQ